MDYQAYPVCLENGIIHYTQGHVSPDLQCSGVSYPYHVDEVVVGGAPRATVATMMILTLIGIHVALARGNAWLLLGSIFMIITAAVAGAVGHNTMGWLCNGGEVALITSMALAVRHEPTVLKTVPSDIPIVLLEPCQNQTRE